MWFAAGSAMSHVARHAERSPATGLQRNQESADGIPTCMRPTDADAGDGCTGAQQYGADAQQVLEGHVPRAGRAGCAAAVRHSLLT